MGDTGRQAQPAVGPDGRGDVWFAAPQCRGDADQHAPRHRRVCQGPRAVLGDVQRAGTGDEQCEPVAILVRRREYALQPDLGALDSIRVDNDVLGRGSERHRQRNDREHAEGLGRVGPRHEQ